MKFIYHENDNHGRFFVFLIFFMKEEMAILFSVHVYSG